MDFCKKFNAATLKRKGETVPVVISIYKDKTFDFILKTAPVSELLKKKANVTKGASNPGKETSGTIKWSAIEEIAKIKKKKKITVDLRNYLKPQKMNTWMKKAWIS